MQLAIINKIPQDCVSLRDNVSPWVWPTLWFYLSVAQIPYSSWANKIKVPSKGHFGNFGYWISFPWSKTLVTQVQIWKKNIYSKLITNWFSSRGRRQSSQTMNSICHALAELWKNIWKQNKTRDFEASWQNYVIYHTLIKDWSCHLKSLLSW